MLYKPWLFFWISWQTSSKCQTCTSNKTTKKHGKQKCEKIIFNCNIWGSIQSLVYTIFAKCIFNIDFVISFVAKKIVDKVISIQPLLFRKHVSIFVRWILQVIHFIFNDNLKKFNHQLHIWTQKNGLLFDHTWRKCNELFPCVLQATYLNYNKLICIAFELLNNLLTINKTPQWFVFV
jgi:hypothetical protein